MYILIGGPTVFPAAPYDRTQPYSRLNFISGPHLIPGPHLVAGPGLACPHVQGLRGRWGTAKGPGRGGSEGPAHGGEHEPVPSPGILIACISLHMDY